MNVEKICYICKEKDNICICGECTKSYTKEMKDYFIKMKTNSDNLQESIEKLINHNQKIFKLYNELNKLKLQNENLKNKYEFLQKEYEQKNKEKINIERKKEYKIEYLENSFKKMFIDKNNLIKIADFYMSSNEEIEDFDITKSSIHMNNIIFKKSNEEIIIVDKKINFDVFKSEKVYIKFKNFFYNLIDFLLDFQKKFKDIFFEYEINKYYIKENDIIYNLELDMNNVFNPTEEQKNNFNHFLQLLNVNYTKIIEGLFGKDIIKQNDFFNLNPFIKNEELNKYSISNDVLFSSFEIIDDFY